jgi:resuscitation-promoting factor RpfB
MPEPPEYNPYPEFPSKQTQPEPTSPVSVFLLLTGLFAMLALAGVMLLVGLLFNNAEQTGTPVVIQTDSATLRINTDVVTVAELLDEQQIVVETGDYLSHDLTDRLQADMTLYVTKARTVALTIDGQTDVIRTSLVNPLDIFNTMNVTLHSGDDVYLDGEPVSNIMLETWTRPITNIMIRRTIPVVIVEGDNRQSLAANGETVGDALYEAGIDIYAADRVIPDADQPLRRNMQITINRAAPLSIIVDGEHIETRTTQTTVGAALTEAAVTLNGLDYSFPSEAADVVPHTTVRVIRVSEELIGESETIPHETVYQADPEVALDERRVLQAGQNGVIERTVRVRYENGVEVGRVVEEETQVSEVQNTVIGYGTQVTIRTMDTPEGPVEYWRKLRVYATSYHPEALGGDDVTSIGMKLQKGVVGIDPDLINYRSEVYVPRYGRGVAGDTGAPRSHPYWIDLGYSDADWVGWHDWIDIYLLTPVPDEIDYLLPAHSTGGPVP